MADVRDQALFRRVENVVHGDRQSYQAQAGAAMPASHRNAVDQLLPKLRCNLRQVILRQALTSNGAATLSKRRVLEQGHRVSRRSCRRVSGVSQIRDCRNSPKVSCGNA